MTEATTVVAEFDNETRTEDLTFTFKTTDENKTEGLTVALTEEVREHIDEIVATGGRWRSNAQFYNDALNYYINKESASVEYETIMDESSWNYDETTTFAVTETLFNEVDLLVKNGHTQWDFKQEFYICALYCYMEDDYPIVERR